ncbi:MAG: manganese efflux pump MntP [Candidatus Eremiobacter antarcticus]|nr:manganese efflux pump [Candidatus Eremiobacteraeota bacterium]MBC5808851.1 manganese efflux pump [Candidatus Eremiobacteraeota bacterium]
MDTFTLAAALGVAGLGSRDRLRVSLIFSAFEAGMPIVGFFLGAVLGRFLGGIAGYTGIAFLFVAGVLLLRPSRDEDKETKRLQLLSKVRGLAIFDLGLSISVDELTIGVSLGLLGLALFITVVWIGIQAFVAAQLGVRLGNRLGEAARERAEALAGLLLIGMAGVLLALKLGRNF